MTGLAHALGVTQQGFMIIWIWVLATTRVFHMMAAACTESDRKLPRAIVLHEAIRRQDSARPQETLQIEAA